MFGRTKTEDVFEKEERLRDELEAARGQLAESVARITATDTEYRQAAAAALASGSDDGAIKLRQALDKLGVRRDGLDQRILDLEPQYQEANKLAQAERVAQAEQARRDRLGALVAEGRQAADCLRFAYEQFQLALSRFDDVRAALQAPEFGTEGLHEVEVLTSLVFQFGPDSLPGRLLANGWRQRSGLRPSYLEVTALQAPA
jgi:hypothetical protein